MNRFSLVVIIYLIPTLLWGQGNYSPDSSREEIQLDEVVVTAQYAPTSSKNSLHVVKVIKAEDIKRQGQISLAEVLTNQLNLLVNTDPILGNGLQIQGIGGENVQIMIDGVPVIGRSNGNIDLSQINLQNIERIEIIEGAMSATYGSNASGGVINLITKKVQAENIQIESQNQYESIGILNNSFSIGARKGKLHAGIIANRYHSQFGEIDSLRQYATVELPSGGTYRGRVIPWNPKTQYGLDGTLRYYVSDSTKITYQYRYFDEELRIYGEIRRPQFRPYVIDDVFQTIRQDHSLTLESYLSPSLYLKSTTAYNQYGRLSKSIRTDLEPDTTSLVPGQQDTNRFTALLHRSILGTQTKRKWNGQLGLEAMYETGAGSRMVDSTRAPFNQADLGNYAGWGSLRFQVSEDLVLQGNLRYGYNSKYRHPLVPAFHLNWQPTPAFGVKMSYARGFRAPSLKELHFNFVDVNHFIVGNPELEAEYSHNASLFAEFIEKLKEKHNFNFSAKFFYNHIRNRIILAEFASLQFNYQNVDQFQTHGLNAQFTYKFGNSLMVKSAFAHTQLFNFWSEDFETRRFTGLNEWQNELSLEIPFVETRLYLTHRFIGQQIRFFTDDEGQLNQGFIGDYHFVNATLSRSFWQDRIFLAVGGKNILNTQTIPTNVQGGGAHSNTGSSILLNWGRTYFVRLNFKVSR